MDKIQKEIESNIDKFKCVVSQSNGTGDICRKYSFCDNGKSRQTIKKYIAELNLNTNHFGLNSYKKKYETIYKECPTCKVTFQTQKNHPREKVTCSIKCSNSFFKDKRYNDEINKKRSDRLKLISVLKPKKEIICKGCGCKFYPKKSNKVQHCSRECIFKNKSYIEKLKNKAIERVKNGTHNGWNSRKIISYPEQFFMGVLTNNNISYQHNKPIGKYFIDFAIVGKKIALEIDGKQHQYDERKKSDALKDKFLIENGWEVYRIPWKSINNESGKLYIKTEIDKFLEFYNGHMA